jgi:NADPH2:quinone reductase
MLYSKITHPRKSTAMATIPTQMKCIGIPKPGGPEALVVEQRPVPTPGKGEVLVKVAAAGVNRPDCIQRRGAYPPPPGASDVPGLEIAGEIVGIGQGARRFKMGDNIMALVPGGGYAEYCTAHELCALPVPSALGFPEAACVPETFFTVWHNVFQRGALKSGETLLIHGGSSGIGTTAIQLAKAFGAKVIVTAGSKEKCDACLKLGADRAINYNTEDFVAETKALTSGNGADVVLDMVGGSYIERNYEAAAVEGRIVQIAFLGGASTMVNFQRLMLKRLTHTGSTLRARSVTDKGEIAAELRDRVLPLLRDGRIKPLIDSTFPLARAAESHARMEAGHHIGKIVLVT